MTGMRAWGESPRLGLPTAVLSLNGTCIRDWRKRRFARDIGFFSRHMEIDFRILDDSAASCVIDLHAKERLKGRSGRFFGKIPLNCRLIRASEPPRCVAFSPFNEG